MKTLLENILDDDVVEFEKKVRVMVENKILGEIDSHSPNGGFLNEEEENIKNILGRSVSILEGKDGHYNRGIFEATFPDKEKADKFANLLESSDYIFEYNVYEMNGGYMVEAFVDPSYVTSEPAFITEKEGISEYVDENGIISEVTRVIKYDSTGKRRVKMQCKPGYKWDGSACVKMTAKELKNRRRGLKRAVLTRRSKPKAMTNFLRKKAIEIRARREGEHGDPS